LVQYHLRPHSSQIQISEPAAFSIFLSIFMFFDLQYGQTVGGFFFPNSGMSHPLFLTVADTLLTFGMK